MIFFTHVDGCKTSRISACPSDLTQERTNTACAGVLQINKRGNWNIFNNQLVRVMKLTFILITIAFMNVYASGYSQTITYSGKDVSMEKVIATIKKQTGYVFFYNTKLLKKAKPVSLDVNNAKLSDVLALCFENQPLDYTIKNKTIVIEEKKKKSKEFFFVPPVKITGKVTDENGEPLPGVSVTVKGSKEGVVTSVDGAYTINAPEQSSVLIFSFIGMQEQEVTVGERTTINVAMTASTENLTEVVVVGFGTQKKVNLTGSVSTIGSEVFESRAVTNVSQALQGAVPGLNLMQSGALAGSLENRPSINIRGVGTIGQGSNSAPLILIDGMEGDINALNPQDIDNISVLKDAAASSIYGSRAPFGVILVSTKKGKPGKTAINVGSSFRSNSPVLLPHSADAYTFATYFNDFRLNAGQGVYFSDERMQRIRDYMDGKITTVNIPRPGQENIWGDGYLSANANVDWYSEIYKDAAPSQEYNVSASGGSENINYYVSGGFVNQTGLMRIGGDGFKRYNATAKVNAKLSKIASLTYIGRFAREEFERPSTMTNSLNQTIANQGWPVLPLYDDNGFLFQSPSPALGLRDGGRGNRQDDGLSQQLQIVVEPLKGWTINGAANYRINDNLYHWDLQKTYNHDVAGKPYLAANVSKVHEEIERINYFNSNIYTDYTRSVGEHNFKIMAGFQSELTKTRLFVAEREGIINPSMPVLDVTTGLNNNGTAVPPVVRGNNQHWSTVGYFGRLNYNFKERYLFEANLRYDGSSRFRPERRWVYAPSVSAGWNIDQEAFWEPVERYINNMKIRGSYGVLGNQNTTDWYPTYLQQDLGLGSWLVNGAKPNIAYAPGLVTSVLAWEKVRIWNLGLDMSFLNSRLNATFDYFTRYTDDMVGPSPELPDILGVDEPFSNNTDLKTNGFDFNISWRDKLRNGLGYNLGFILSDSRRKITSYPNPAGLLNTFLAGHYIGEIWGYKTIGIAKTKEEMDAHLATLPNGGQNALGGNWAAGDIMYEDVNGDGKINAGSNTEGDHGDLVLLGNSAPRFTVGINLGVDWKGVDIRGFFQGVLKRDYFADGYYFWGNGATIYSSAGLTQHMDYFRADPNHPLGQNLDAYYPRPLVVGSAKNQATQSRYLQNASYLRLKNLQLGYTLPKSIIQKVGIKNLRVYLSGENLFTITDMATMFDPETVDGGWNGSVYPLSKVYSFGLNINL